MHFRADGNIFRFHRRYGVDGASPSRRLVSLSRDSAFSITSSSSLTPRETQFGCGCSALHYDLGVRFFHSADWQIGARFRAFGADAGRLSHARVGTLRRALEEAERREADAFLIAGDLFEDNQVEADWVSAVYELFEKFDRVPVFILPGNHDPFTGPSSIWGRRPFSTPPRHVRIFSGPEAIRFGEGWLVANPLRQKRSMTDPSLELEALARELPRDEIKIGITHGSPAIESLHQADDFPIALNAASRAGLDYLAIGHWHGAMTLDGGRILMPGTPEPTGFSEQGNGAVLEVVFARSGEPPRVTPLRLAEWTWRVAECDLSDLTNARSRMEQLLAESGETIARTVLRVILRGSAGRGAAPEFREWLEDRTKSRAGGGILEVVDETVAEMSAAELLVLRQEHPLVGMVLDDLAALSAVVKGEPSCVPGHAGFSAGELQSLCQETGCGFEELTPKFFETARRLMLAELREATC
jgi:DNA repair exonuclease SbcCD nuclease subunit